MKKINLFALTFAAGFCISGQLPSKDSQALEMTKNSNPVEQNEVKEEMQTQVVQAKRKSSARKVIEGINNTADAMGAAKKAVRDEINHKD